ncbi:MAG TPA: hypothetical protein VF044_05395 [Actinomycetota bacterium]
MDTKVREVGRERARPTPIRRPRWPSLAAVVAAVAIAAAGILTLSGDRTAPSAPVPRTWDQQKLDAFGARQAAEPSIRETLRQQAAATEAAGTVSVPGDPLVKQRETGGFAAPTSTIHDSLVKERETEGWDRSGDG